MVHNESDRLSTFLTGLFSSKGTACVNLVTYIQFQCEFNLHIVIQRLVKVFYATLLTGSFLMK